MSFVSETKDLAHSIQEARGNFARNDWIMEIHVTIGHVAYDIGRESILCHACGDRDEWCPTIARALRIIGSK